MVESEETIVFDKSAFNRKEVEKHMDKCIAIPDVLLLEILRIREVARHFENPLTPESPLPVNPITCFDEATHKILIIKRLLDTLNKIDHKTLSSMFTNIKKDLKLLASIGNLKIWKNDTWFSNINHNFDLFDSFMGFSPREDSVFSTILDNICNDHNLVCIYFDLFDYVYSLSPMLVNEYLKTPDNRLKSFLDFNYLIFSAFENVTVYTYEKKGRKDWYFNLMIKEVTGIKIKQAGCVVHLSNSKQDS